MKKLFVFGFLLLSINALAQIRFSLATDLSLFRNFSPKQKFFAIGQTVQGNFHFNKKQTAYAWLTYYTTGRFKNNFTAIAKSSVTNPASINYTVNGSWRNREISLGLKHYFKGSFDEEKNWSLYGIAGFGLMFTFASNSFATYVDTSLYKTATVAIEGTGQFKRLTIDLGFGTEFPVGGNFFVFGDVHTWIPTTSYPSPYLHNNKNVPMPLIINAGLRILFGID